MYDSFVPLYSLQWAYLLRHLPFMRKVFGVFNIPRMNFCNAEFAYLDLVDTVNNAGNKIIFNSSIDGNGKTFSCPGSIFQSAVKILRFVCELQVLVVKMSN